MSIVPQAQTVGGGSAEWQTPSDLFARLNQRYRFNYDAFASHDNALCDLHSTQAGTFEHIPNANILPGQFLGSRSPKPISDDDGLTFDWEGRRVYMNPPFTRDLITKCVRKAVDERESAEIIVALLPAATETMWFQQLVFPYAHIDWLPRRVRFINPETGKRGNSPTTGHIIAVFKSTLLP